MYAITPFGVGRPVGVRAIEPDWDLAAGETFVVDDWHEDLVLAEDGASLRVRRSDDPSATPSIRTISRRAFLRRLSVATQEAIVSAAGTSPAVAYWLHVTTAGPVDLDHADTTSGIDVLLGLGLIGRNDKTALLADAAADELP